MPRTLLVLLFSGACLAAAGSCSKPNGTPSSGVPGLTYLDEMTESERETFCTWSVDKMGGGGRHPCDWGTVTIMTVEQCEAFVWPHCTVALEEACAAALTGACDRGENPQCTDYQTCADAHPGKAPRFYGDAGVDDGKRYYPDYRQLPEGQPVPLSLVERYCVYSKACVGGADDLAACVAGVAFGYPGVPSSEPTLKMQIGCAAAVSDCEGYARCRNRNHSWAYCARHPENSCDGEVSVYCEGIPNKPALSATDCASLGQKCVDNLCTSPTGVCTEPAGTTSCKDGVLHTCNSVGQDFWTPCSAEEPCGDLSGTRLCLSSGGECSSLDPPRRCGGTAVVDCRAYGTVHRELRTDCAKVEGMGCGAVPSVRCAPAAPECDPATDPQSCAGTVLSGCWGGKHRSLDCATLGFATCAAVEGTSAFCR
ncbi:MAG TPA: hypothetical protein VGK67_02065 [Myxococcales bacterium]|jgi:hypothetical protein